MIPGLAASTGKKANPVPKKLIPVELDGALSNMPRHAASTMPHHAIHVPDEACLFVAHDDSSLHPGHFQPMMAAGKAPSW
jgi:hypothetical protein